MAVDKLFGLCVVSCIILCAVRSGFCGPITQQEILPDGQSLTVVIDEPIEAPPPRIASQKQTDDNHDKVGASDKGVIINEPQTAPTPKRMAEEAKTTAAQSQPVTQKSSENGNTNLKSKGSSVSFGSEALKQKVVIASTLKPSVNESLRATKALLKPRVNESLSAMKGQVDDNGHKKMTDEGKAVQTDDQKPSDKQDENNADGNQESIKPKESEQDNDDGNDDNSHKDKTDEGKGVQPDDQKPSDKQDENNADGNQESIKPSEQDNDYGNEDGDGNDDGNGDDDGDGGRGEEIKQDSENPQTKTDDGKVRLVTSKYRINLDNGDDEDKPDRFNDDDGDDNEDDDDANQDENEQPLEKEPTFDEEDDDEMSSESVSKGRPSTNDEPRNSNSGKYAYAEQQQSTHFMSYFLIAVVFVACFYLVFHNRQKIKAYFLEGRNGRNGRKRKGGGSEYRQLSTAEEVLPSAEKGIDSKLSYTY